MSKIKQLEMQYKNVGVSEIVMVPYLFSLI